MEKKDFVIALGGSVVAPDGIDTDFLRKFHDFIKAEVKKGLRFVIVIGGGKITRVYQKAAAEITDISDEDKDWIGIYATRFNAHLVKAIFKEQANPIVLDSRFRVKEFGKYPVVIGAGWKPGWSTDFVACQIACDFNIKKVIILGKPDYVYTADFEKDHNARPLEKISWQDYLKLIPKKWSPGLNSPVDPIAASLAEKENLKVIVAGGKSLDNLKQILRGNKFKGTVIN